MVYLRICYWTKEAPVQTQTRADPQADPSYSVCSVHLYQVSNRGRHILTLTPDSRLFTGEQFYTEVKSIQAAREAEEIRQKTTDSFGEEDHVVISVIKNLGL